MAKKKQKEEVLETPATSEVTISQERWVNCEWCFQFDNDEPHIFAWTDDNIDSEENPEVTFTVSNTKDSFISFSQPKTGKSFKLFSRELTDEGKELRRLSQQNQKNQ